MKDSASRTFVVDSTNSRKGIFSAWLFITLRARGSSSITIALIVFLILF